MSSREDGLLTTFLSMSLAFITTLRKIFGLCMTQKGVLRLFRILSRMGFAGTRRPTRLKKPVRQCRYVLRRGFDEQFWVHARKGRALFQHLSAHPGRKRCADGARLKHAIGGFGHWLWQALIFPLLLQKLLLPSRWSK